MKKRGSFIKIPAIKMDKRLTGNNRKLSGLFKNFKFPKLKLGFLKGMRKSNGTGPGGKGTNDRKPVNSGKRFTMKMFTGGIRGRIAMLVIALAIIPVLMQTIINVSSQTHSIRTSMTELNNAVNLGLIERINANIDQSKRILELIPQCVDILALDSYSQERVIRKIAAGKDGKGAFKEITLTDKNGFVLFSMDNKLIGSNESGNQWYTEAMKGKTYISDSYIDKKLHMPVFNLSVPVVDQNMQPAGVLSAKISFDEIQRYVKDTKIGKNGIAYIVDKNGVVLAHPEFGKVMDGYNTVTNKIEGPMNIVKGKSGSSEYLNDKGQKVVGTYNLIPITGWGLITEIGVEEALAPVNSVRTSAIILMVVVLIVAVVASFVLAFIITKPLVNMARIASEIKDGNLKKRLQVTSHDEIGDLQNAFNLMSESLCTILEKVDSAAGEITEASKRLSESAAISSSATEEITAIVEDVAEGAQSQMNSVKTTAEAARDISQSVESASGKTQSVALTATEAAEVAQKGSDNINIISEKINVIRDNVVNSATLVEKLGKKSEEVTGIVKVIRDIAGKTNMLALNASIEAARAGDAGKGFAVVANEIRNLAEQTRDASKNIETLLLEIQRETEATVTAMNQGLIEVEQGTSAISATYSTFDRIIKEIHLVADEVNQVSTSVLELKGESNSVLQAVNQVNEIAEATSRGTQNVLASTEEQSSAMQEINTSAAKLNEMAVNLQTLLRRFKY